MRVMTSFIFIGMFAMPTASAAGQSDVASVDSFQTRVWLDRGDEAVVQRGDEIRVYYRTTHDAYASIFHIDTDGEISLIFPQHPEVDHLVLGGRDYRLVFPESSRWVVDEDPGAGYFFMVASPEPLDFSTFPFDVEEGWDLSGISDVVYEDPYVAIDDYVAVVLPSWEVNPYALDFLSYSVGDTHTYPRFLCYDCHGFQEYSSWNPYSAACSSYQVLIWDDPWFYPSYRYAGTRVVVARPFGPRPRYGVAPRVSTRWAPIVRTRAAPPRRVAEFKEAVRRAPSFMPRNPIRRPSRAVRSGSVTAGVDSRAAPKARVANRPVSGGQVSRRVPSATTTRGAAATRATPGQVRAGTRAPAGPRVRPSGPATRLGPASPPRPKLERRPGSNVRTGTRSVQSPRGRGVTRPSTGGRPARSSATRSSDGRTPRSVGASVRPSSQRPATTRSRTIGAVRAGPQRPAARSAPRAGPSRPTSGPTVRPAPRRPAGRVAPSRGSVRPGRNSGRPARRPGGSGRGG